MIAIVKQSLTLFIFKDITDLDITEMVKNLV
jgi:hypothetical protein